MFLTDKGKSRSWNVFLWVALFTGTGMLMCAYSMEWYARINCPVNTVSNLLILYVLLTQRGCRIRMVVGCRFSTTCAISAYHY